MLLNLDNIVADIKFVKKKPKFNQICYLQSVHARVHFCFKKGRLSNCDTVFFIEINTSGLSALLFSLDL